MKNNKKLILVMLYPYLYMVGIAISFLLSSLDIGFEPMSFMLVLGLIASQFAQDALYEEGANDDLNNYLFDCKCMCDSRHSYQSYSGISRSTQIGRPCQSEHDHKARAYTCVCAPFFTWLHRDLYERMGNRIYNLGYRY